MLTRSTVTAFLDETASSSPAPGGGSVSALAAALGVALASMVCRLTIGKKKYADVEAEMQSLLVKLEELRSRCTTLIDEDAASFNAVMAAMGMPKETEEQRGARTQAIQQATKGASLVPLNLMELCAESVELVRAVAERGNVNSLSDAGVAALMLQAGCEGAGLNVDINLGSLTDAPFVASTRSAAYRFKAAVNGQVKTILTNVHQKLGA